MRLVWLHGLEGSPTGYKATQLRARGWDLLAPDCRGQRLAERIHTAEQALAPLDEVVLIGSSYGGLAAAWIGSQRPLAGLLLLAPALHHAEPPVTAPDSLVIPSTTPTHVVHGTDDTIVPVQVSRDLAARCPHVHLVEREDGHALSASLDAIHQALVALTGG